MALRDFQSDPKGPPRIRDSAAIRRKLLRDRECRGCGEGASEGHHIVFRSHGGDDVEENIAPLCGGDGSCHTRLHVDFTADGDELRAEIGRNLLADEIAYVVEKMGGAPGLDYLHRRYGYPLPSPEPQPVADLVARRRERQRERALARSRGSVARRREHGRPR